VISATNSGRQVGVGDQRKRLVFDLDLGLGRKMRSGGYGVPPERSACLKTGRWLGRGFAWHCFVPCWDCCNYSADT